jgi:hypothetical protein
VGSQALAFGFAAKSPEATFFLIGSLYAEAVAYIRSGNLDLAAQRLAAIETESIKLQVPSALYNYVSRLRNLVETQRYPAEVLGEFAALLQPFLEEYGVSQSADRRTLLRAGAWLVDMSLAAAAGDKELLKQVSALHYFSSELQRLQAPKGVLDALAEFTAIVSKPDLNEQDVARVLTLVQTMQTVLG